MTRPVRAVFVRPYLLTGLLAIAMTLLLGATDADASHRCGHRGKVCTPPPADTTPPDTSISSGPSGTVTSSSASFSFTSSESGSTFECRMDASAWSACASPTSYAGLTNATHLFEVRAKDASGNLDTTPAARSFTVNASTSTGGQATTRPVGSPPLSDADSASRVVRNGFEPRPENFAANHRVPSDSELSAFRSATGTGSSVPSGYRGAVSGRFSGTTDEVIQFAAHKWGIDEDVLRAVAVIESGWNQGWVGDGGYSYGLMQIKRETGEPWTGWTGTHPLSQVSTAFNVDYYGAVIRACYEGYWGHTGDLWGCVGSWYSGGWYDQGAQNYIASAKEKLTSRTWAQPGF